MTVQITGLHPHGSLLDIEPRAPFRLDLTTWALRRRPHNAIDGWDASSYRRVLCVDGGPVALSVTQVGETEVPRLSVVLGGRPIDRSTERLARSALDRLLGLSVDLSAFATKAAQDPLLGPIAGRMRGLKPPRFPTVFEALVNGVACQQLSLAVGIHLLNRLAADRGRPVSDDLHGPRAFPDPRSSQASSRTSSTATASARPRRARSSRLPGRSSPAIWTWRAWNGLTIPPPPNRLTSIRGIGRWTAEDVLLRGLGRLHVFPGDDVGAHNKLRRLFGIDMPLDHDSVQQLVARWQPYAGVVYFHLLLDSLSQADLVTQHEVRQHTGGAS